MEPPRQCLKRILHRGISCGQLPNDLDIEAAMALLLGPMLYAHVFQREQNPKMPDIGPMTAQTFWRAHSQNRKEQIKKSGVGVSRAKSRKPSSGD
jgi:hypothetical protein